MNTTPTVTPTEYVVSVLPEGAGLDWSVWSITVRYRGKDSWAVVRGTGSGHGQICLSKGGDWEYEMIPSERRDDWLADHRFDLDAALALARKHAPHVRLNGMTALEVLADHHRRQAAT